MCNDEEYVVLLFQKAMYNVGVKTAEELQLTINKLTVSIQRAKAKILGIEPPPEEPEVGVHSKLDLLCQPLQILMHDIAVCWVCLVAQ